MKHCVDGAVLDLEIDMGPTLVLKNSAFDLAVSEVPVAAIVKWGHYLILENKIICINCLAQNLA